MSPAINAWLVSDTNAELKSTAPLAAEELYQNFLIESTPSGEDDQEVNVPPRKKYKFIDGDCFETNQDGIVELCSKLLSGVSY